MRTRGAAVVVLGMLGAMALGAPAIAPHPIDRSFPALLNAPPTWPHVRTDTGEWRRPFIYPWRIVNQLEQRYEQDRSHPVAIDWMQGGRLAVSADETMPLLLLGSDSYGRDVLARLLFGARVSLGLAATAGLIALTLGTVVGGLAGYVGGTIDEVMMRGAELVLVLPAMYVALILRAALPLVLPVSTVFLLLAVIFGIVAAPNVARVVRSIVRTERHRDYVMAARSLGAGHLRLLMRHLLPAARGVLVVQMTVLVPAFIVAEATLSFVGLGFPDAVASWGTMLHDASSVRVLADFPWLLCPAAAMFVLVLALNLTLQRGAELPVSLDADRTRRLDWSPRTSAVQSIQ